MKLADFLTSESTLNKYDFTAEQLPALFLPNTYRMFWDTDADQFLQRMAQEFKNFWLKIEPHILCMRFLHLPRPSRVLRQLAMEDSRYMQ